MMPRQPETLCDLLNDLVEQCGDSTALIEGRETLTFAQLEDRSARLASSLASLGVGPGDKVAVWLPNTFAWVELEFALARLGAVAVAINTRSAS
jgi:fatty-acyl-CoA synthase